MKSLILSSSLLLICLTAFAEIEQHEPAIIRSIDDYETPPNYIEVSEDGLPANHYVQLIQLMGTFGFSFLTDPTVNSLFDQLERNPRARMKQPGGQCSYRRAYIQNLFKKQNIVSGKFYIKCPSNNGRLRLRDQVSGRYYTYANFHDTNIVAVNTRRGPEFRVLDVQFEDRPVTLHEYLTELEASQRFRPLRYRGSTSGLCYWSITTPYLSY